MAPATSPNTVSSPTQILRTFVLITAVAVIAAALWTTSASVLENIRFAHGTSQILQLITAAHMLADRDKNFATQPSEDVLNDLTRAGLLNANTDEKPAILIDPWKGVIHSISSPPSSMRIEADVPGHDCSRLALFFIKNGGDLGLTAIETRPGEGQDWQKFYAPSQGISLAGSAAAEDACQRAARVTLAFIFTVR